MPIYAERFGDRVWRLPFSGTLGNFLTQLKRKLRTADLELRNHH
jgi:hypothetical protein